MKRKYSNIIFLILLLLPLVHLFDNQVIAKGSSSIPPSENSLEICQSTDFELKIHLGDPFTKSRAYSSTVFNPDDDVLITGNVRNSAYGGSPTITVAIWLVSSKQPYQIVKNIVNLTGTLPLKASTSFYSLNGDADVIWNIANQTAGTYRFMAQVFVSGVPESPIAVSGKSLVLRQLRLADFHITYSESFRTLTEYSLPTVSTSLGLDYYGGYLYLSDYTNNAILKIDATDGSIVDTIVISGYSGNPYDLVYHSKHGFYIAYRHKDQIINTDFNGNFKFSIPFNNPMGLCMLGSYLGVTNDSSSTMYEVYPFSGDYYDSWSLSTIYPYGLAVDWTNNLIWYADCQNDVIKGMDYSTHTDQFTLDTGELYGIAFDGTYLWGWDNSGKKLVKLHPHTMKFDYNITNVGNCPITGTLALHIEKMFEDWTSRGLGESPFLGWDYYDAVDISSHLNGARISLPAGQSVVGQAFWDIPSGLARAAIYNPPPTNIFRLYFGILDSNGAVLYNLNDSVPFEHPTQGGMYIDSDKLPKLKMTRDITKPTKYLEQEELNVTLYLEVIGLPPEEIGVFNLTGTNLLTGIGDISIREELNQDVLPDPKDMWCEINGDRQLMPSSAVDGNEYFFNESSFSDESFNSMGVGEQMTIRYNLEANFSPEVKATKDFKEQSGLNLVSYREDLVINKASQYDVARVDSIQVAQYGGFWINPDLILQSQLGVIVWLGPLLSEYDAIDVLALFISLIIWINHLPSWLDGVIYFIDEDMATDDAQNFYGFSAAQKAQFNALSTCDDQSDYIYDHVADRNVIAQYIEDLVTSEAEEEDWEYMMLVGGDNIIPMKLIDSQLQVYLDYSTATIATDFYYGDLTPEANLGANGYMPEVIVSRLPGRDPQEIINLLLAGNQSSSGEAALIAYYKGEDTLRRLADLWGAVKEPANTYWDSEGDYTSANLRNVLNPALAPGGAANYPYSFVLFSDHAGVTGWGDGTDVWVSRAQVSAFGDYQDGARPFVFFRACKCGHIGDPGDCKDGNTFGIADSVCLEYLSKGPAGVLASTRNSFSPSPEAEVIVLADTAVRPDNSVPLSLSGTYKTGTINVGGNMRDCFLVDPNVANTYDVYGIDFNDDGDYSDVVGGASEVMDERDETFFESPYHAAGTFFWRYHFICGWNGDTLNWEAWLEQNSQEDWNDIFVQYFTGELGLGIMDGMNVGTAFYNAKRNYWAYMQTGVHTAAGADPWEPMFDYQLLHEFNLYGVPFYRPILEDPPGIENYTIEFTTVNDWGLNATFEVHNYTEEEVAGKTLFHVAGAALTSGSSYPRLPIITENVSLPAGISISEVSVVWSDSQELPGTYNISLSTAGTLDSHLLQSNLQASLSGTYPNKLYDYTTLTEKDGSATVFLSVFPFQWNADTGNVTFYSNITLHIDVDDSLDDSVSIAASKDAENKKIGRGSNFLMNLEIANNGSNPVYNIRVSEYIEGEFQNSTAVSKLSSSGLNSTFMMGFIVKAPLRYFSGWVSTETILTYQDGAGTTYTMTVTKSVYLETWLGILILILCLIVAIAVTVLILKYR
jgi:hypothetical protein